jgi:protein-tyrosine phosphatase
MEEKVGGGLEGIRRLPFAGVLNFRDIGGYPTSDAGPTRWGAVYRSDSLHFLAPEDLPPFDALSIKVIYDLRRTDELTRFPGPREYIHLELPSRAPLKGAESAKLKTRLDGEQWLLGDYVGMLDEGAVTFGHLFSHLARPGRLPAVIHCLAGKDRTGITIALLLTALGVEREIVLDDYQLTNDYRGVAHVPEVIELFVRSGIAREAAEGMLSAPRQAMATALEILDERHAGIENYLLGPCGMSPATLNALKKVLIT